MTIKEARLKKSLTQKQVCEALDIPQRTFQNWEQGKAYPPGWLEKILVKEILSINKSED